MKDKKAVELPVSTLIIVILALICLVVVLFIFNSAARRFGSEFLNKLKDALIFWNSTKIKP